MTPQQLHHGAKVRKEVTLSAKINDPSELLTWASADRAKITFSNARDFKSKQAALRAIIKQWVKG